MLRRNKLKDEDLSSLLKKLSVILWALIFLLLQFCLNDVSFAQQTFVVRAIEVEGLNRISAATVRSYLHINTRQVLKPGQTGEILRNLYQTGFFEQVSLVRNENTLI